MYSKLETNIIDGYLVVFSNLDEAHCRKTRLNCNLSSNISCWVFFNS